jgi:hypothetical protein
MKFPTVMIVGFQSLNRGELFFLPNQKPERNENAGALEPWNLLLGCKAGLYFLQFLVTFVI